VCAVGQKVNAVVLRDGVRVGFWLGRRSYEVLEGGGEHKVSNRRETGGCISEEDKTAQQVSGEAFPDQPAGCVEKYDRGLKMEPKRHRSSRSLGNWGTGEKGTSRGQKRTSRLLRVIGTY